MNGNHVNGDATHPKAPSIERIQIINDEKQFTCASEHDLARLLCTELVAGLSLLTK